MPLKRSTRSLTEPVERDCIDCRQTVRRAIEIRDGAIQNPSILAFQARSLEYPRRTPTAGR